MMGLVDDVQLRLQQDGIVDGSSGWPSFRRYMSDVSSRIVVFTEDGGFEPDTPTAHGLGSSPMADPAVQVRVRGERRASDEALLKVEEIRDALHGILREQVGYTVYQRIKAQTFEPLFLGFDEKERPEFSISFRALRSVAPISS